MDLNRKYSDHQAEVLRASAAGDLVSRNIHLDRATAIAGQIAAHQKGLGAGAACAWSAAYRRGTGTALRTA
ncbi:MAG: hypothetical protein P0Y56_17060 [Candidatus Andeanibacterium colombiense]|uniref:Uncharacterized protein n=1 Tax=Candidatus Andeanibacterium colombiense TaxID=3121345 RepID=A0AAJ5X6F6_9SPHN|nr:MAG: hypothetical protein P0Y56_17060 [Sphingomonadaceae bacterium]